MKTILAEAEQASGRTQQYITSSLTPAAVHREKSSDGMRVSFSLPKAHHTPPSISPGSSRAAAPSPAWRTRTPPQSGIAERHVGSSPGRSLTAQMQARTPPGSSQLSTSDKEKASAAPAMQKSWSTQSLPPGPSTVTHAARPGLGPVISPAKAKAGLTATRHTSGNAWVLPTAEPVSRSPSSSAPISFAEIQQLQSQPSTATTERRSLRDIQTEEAELQAEAEFMIWWTAEEERIRLENEAVAASLMVQQEPQKQQHRSGGKKDKKSTAPAPPEGKSSRKTPIGGERRHQHRHAHPVGQRVPSESDGRGSSQDIPRRTSSFGMTMRTGQQMNDWVNYEFFCVGLSSRALC